MISVIVTVQIGVCRLILPKKDLTSFVVEVDWNRVELSLSKRLVVEKPRRVVLVLGWCVFIKYDLVVLRAVCISIDLNNL